MGSEMCIRDSCCSVLRWCCLFHPISLVLPKETGWSPKEKRLGWWRPREVSGPTRLSHSRGRCHSAAKVSASRTDWITRPRGEGLGLDVDWRLKVFCPAFLQKSGRGPGAEPLAARRSARNSPCAKEAQEGVKGGTLAGGSPFYFLRVLRVRRYFGRFSLACPAIRPHFFGACPKKRCRAAKEKRFFTPAAPAFCLLYTSPSPRDS